MIPDTFSEAAVNLIKAFEGLHDVKDDGFVHAYRCPAGKWTIGWGSTMFNGKPVTRGMTITKDEADNLLIDDITSHAEPIHRLVTVPLTQPQYDALASFIFNVGAGNFARSTLLKKLNRGDYDGAAREFARWNKAKGKVLRGLTRRRTAEAALFMMDVPIGRDGEKQPQEVEIDEKPLAKSRTLWGAGAAAAGAALAEAASQIEPLVALNEHIQWVFLGVSLAGIALVTYARINDRNEGRN